MVRKICILILLVSMPCAVFAQKEKNVKAQKLTEAEIKEGERIFTTFKKQLEATNDLRTALHGLTRDNWFKYVVLADLWEINSNFPVVKTLILKNLKLTKQLYLNTLCFYRNQNLYENINPANKGTGDHPLGQLFNQLPEKVKKTFEEFTSEDFKFTTRKQVVRASQALNLGIAVEKNALRKLQIGRAANYKKGLDKLNIYSDEKAWVSACDSICYGLPKGSDVMQKIEGFYVLMVGKVNRRIRVIGVFAYYP